jgi:hypothetical protein
MVMKKRRPRKKTFLLLRNGSSEERGRTGGKEKRRVGRKRGHGEMERQGKRTFSEPTCTQTQEKMMTNEDETEPKKLKTPATTANL